MRIIRDLEAAKSLLLERAQVELAGEAYETVQQILGEVRSRGDSALFNCEEGRCPLLKNRGLSPFFST